MLIETLERMISGRLAVIGAGATVRAAALALDRRDIGLLIVCSETGKAAGVVSKSDLVRHLAHFGSSDATAAMLMSRQVVSCGPNDDVHTVWQTMAAQALQNIPVLSGDGQPLGILDIRDAMKALFEQEELQEQLLANYIAGVGYQ
jgi:CBS domain-containing protein